MADSTQKATELSDPISFFSYRGHISRPIFFLCLLIELVLLFLGVIVLAAAMNSTGSGGGVGLYNYLREIPATVKALWDVRLSRVPKYLGFQFPITGDGRATWGSAPTSTTDILLP